MTEKTLIKNAKMVNEGATREGDLLIGNGRIAKIADSISADDSMRVIDADGAFLLPGMIDDQVHFREPGLTWKAGIWSESRAAAAGGITSFMEMPNTNPATVTLDALEEKYAIGAQKSLVNYSFYLGATNDNLDVIRSLQPGMAAGIKIFMGASTGNMLVDNQETLTGVFRDAPALIATHCEFDPLIKQNLNAALERYGHEIPLTEHPNIRSAEACYQSTQMAMSLSREFHAPLHVLHLTTAREMELFEPGPIGGKLITGEVCVHFLHFSADDYPRLGNRIKCNPAIKTAADRQALLKALQDGRLDIIATDHAPHTKDEKASTDYLKAPAGLPLVQDALLSVLELYHDGLISLEEIVNRTAHNVARRFHVADRGYLREGYWADLVIVDPEAPTEVTPQRVLSKCGWSPFEGETFRSSIVTTIVNGQPVWDAGQIVEAGSAARLQFGKQREL
ncbi:MAG: dihydroorotase [Xanthomonadales bacterium]|nr:dihydroorotase [Gammaproteobacteria bacterium]NND57765.1 dihydroorotase [Xanthomonadales bacterium]NNK51480.1 dihydroorotase [Xanthomonadales bacterium]